MIDKINFNCYSGNLLEYDYPQNCEFRGLLKFLKRISSKKQIHLTDINYWTMPYPDPNFDIYIICAFGEFVNEDFVNQLDRDPNFENKHLILLTSQCYESHNLNRFKIFYLEHMHTIVDFFNPEYYTKIINRPITHGLLSRRNALHKSIVLNKLAKHYSESLAYTLCNIESSEFKLENLKSDTQQLLGVNLSIQQIRGITNLHNTIKTVPGDQWSIDNEIYKNTQLNWVVESIFLSRQLAPTAYLTEKIIKPIVSGSCFVLVSQIHSYQRLKSMGFETFENKFQINFDTDVDSERINKIFQLIESTDFENILSDPDVQDMIDYNYDYFFHKFFNQIELENQPRIESIINYINEL